MHFKIDKDAFDLLSGLYASDLLYCRRGFRIGIHRIIWNVRLIGQLFRFRNNWNIFRHSSPWGRIIGLKQSSCVFFLVLRPVFTSKKMAVGDNNQNLYQRDEALRLEGSAQAEKKPFGIFPYGKRRKLFPCRSYNGDVVQVEKYKGKFRFVTMNENEWFARHFI